jgi:(1->4)-alpha-D-glucan 1-alpha-D-glucosylmutase
MLRVPPPDAETALFLSQNVFGVWPVDGVVTDELRERLHAYTEKAIREAGAHTTWDDPNHEFESAAHGWLDEVIDGPVATELTSLVTRLDRYGRSDALGQKLIQLTAPGVPDVYQGTELWEDSLVDPDNRRPVDYELHRGALRTMEHPKLRVVTAALRLRRERPDTFLSGGYRPVLATGPAREHVVAFLRGDDVLVAVSRWTVRLDDTGWGDTALQLPDGTWTDRLTGRRFEGPIDVADLYADLPVALLENTRG